MTDKQVEKIRKDFLWFSNNKGWCYFDSGATSLKPKFVLDKEREYYEKYGCNPHNKDSMLAYKSHQLIRESREEVAKLLDCDSHEVIFTSCATESLNLIANGLSKYVKKNDEILLTYMEHTSNMLPWFNLGKKNQCKFVLVGKNKIPNEKDILSALTKNTKIVTFCDVSNILGTYIDCNALAKKIKQYNKNIIVVVDATQSIPHIKHNLKNSGVDFLVFSGHKMLAPMGIGVCYINKQWIDKINPIKFGGGMNSIVDPNKKTFTYADGVDKFEGGTPNVGGICGLGAAIKYLNKIGWDNITKHEWELKEYFNKKVHAIKNIKYYNPDYQLGLIYFNIKGISAQDLANYLGSKKIIVRSGLSCAKASNVSTNINSAVRISMYIYNTRKEIDYIIKILKDLKKGDVLDNVI